MAYITAEFADDLFPADNLFVVGGDAQPNDRAEIYSNGPLRYGSSYAFFLRTYPMADFVSLHIFPVCNNFRLNLNSSQIRSNNIMLCFHQAVIFTVMVSNTRTQCKSF